MGRRHHHLRKLVPAVAAVLLLTLVPLAAAEPPTLMDDEVTIAEDADAIEIDVLANDTDDGVLDLTAVGDPPNGDAEIVGTMPAEKVLYEPGPDYNGPDGFAYAVDDGEPPPEELTDINVTVTPVNDVPIAVDDPITVQEDVPISAITPASNDSRGADNESGQVLSVTALTPGPGSIGSWSLNGGVVSYVPPENYVGQDTITYTVCDDGKTNTVDDPLCDDGAITITLTPVNDAPRASLDSYTVGQGGNTLDVRENDSPGPVNDGPQTLAAPTIATPPLGGTAMVNPDGTITYVPAATTAGLDFFFYSVCDNEGACAQGQVNLEVQPQLGVGDATGVEGDSGTTTATFSVSLNATFTKAVTVGYATASGSAVSGSDFQSASGTLTFAPGEGAKSVVVNVNGDLGVEADEAFFLDLSAPVNATIGVARGSATIRNDDTIGCDVTGTPGADRLTGTPNSETICGLGGNDTIAGGGGDDLVSGGPGNDRIDAGAGSDTVTGGPGNDRIVGGAGDDALDGDSGNDTLSGDAGGDAIEGGDGNDSASGGEGSDTIDGSGGSDTVRGDAGEDTIDGSGGNDKLAGSGDNDRVDGGGGSDRVAGDAGDDWVDGGPGNDPAVSGGIGSDTLRGEGGRDVLTPGSGNDSILGGGGVDLLSFASSPGGIGVDLGRGRASGDGRDRIGAVENVTGSRFADLLLGSSAANVLNGGAGNDRVFGGSGNDTLLGGPGSDALDGGAGGDRCSVGPGGSSARSC
jgi:Ca2+-binding RTX toxin-like protein